VRLPRRLAAICGSEPIGLDLPRRTLSTPAMNVVATAPRPGVRIPSRPVAGATLFLESFKRPFSLSCSAPGGTLRVRRQGRGSLDWDLERLRARAVTGLVVDVCDALDHRDPGAHGDDDDHDLEYPPVQRQTEERLRGRQQRDALRPLYHADLGVE